MKASIELYLSIICGMVILIVMINFLGIYNQVKEGISCKELTINKINENDSVKISASNKVCDGKKITKTKVGKRYKLGVHFEVSVPIFDIKIPISHYGFTYEMQ